MLVPLECDCIQMCAGKRVRNPFVQVYVYKLVELLYLSVRSRKNGISLCMGCGPSNPTPTRERTWSCPAGPFPPVDIRKKSMGSVTEKEIVERGYIRAWREQRKHERSHEPERRSYGCFVFIPDCQTGRKFAIKCLHSTLDVQTCHGLCKPLF